MKPARFKYFAPETLGEAIGLLEEHGDEAKVLAGGQSLVPLLNMRLARPGVLVDICRIPGLDTVTENGSLTIGATARQLDVRRSAQITGFAPILDQVMPHIGHVATQSRGTFGGMAAHADPAAEIPAVVLALEAELVAEGPAGERVIPASEFFSTYFTTSLAENEILTKVRLPRSTASLKNVFLEIARRHGDFALVGVAAIVELGPDDEVQSARLAMCGVGGAPVRASEAEASLVGTKLDDAAATQAGELAAATLEPPTDVHASSRYRKDVASVLVRRALAQVRTNE